MRGFIFYIHGSQFDLVGDHKPLEVLLNGRGNPSPRIERWRLWLQNYSPCIVYQPGIQNAVDFLSRKPVTTNTTRDPGGEFFLNVNLNLQLNLGNSKFKPSPLSLYGVCLYLKRLAIYVDYTHVDYCGPFPSREYLFVAVDETSKYPEVHVTRSSTAATAIIHLTQMFATHGISEVITSDNVPFGSEEFAAWCKQ